jgi:ubiquinone/menaquinone biosynthesis C-methylase UbiE
MDDPIFINTPLHQQNPLERFSNRAKDYARYRPSYPEAAIAQLLQGLGEPTRLVVADVGAGTGISAHLLAQAGATVWAIEPNAAMREAGVSHPRLHWQAGQAEQTGLEDASVHLVTCCQAFHWCDPQRSLAEFHRILQHQGRLGLMWNDRDRGDELTQRYTDILKASAGRNYVSHAQERALDQVEQSSLFRDFQTFTFSYVQEMTEESLMGRALSSSYVPKSGSAYEQLVADLKALYRQYEAERGQVAITYVTRLYVATAT